MVWWCPSVHPSVRPGLRPDLRPSVTVFRTFLLHVLTYTAEICMSPSSYEHSIKFECRQFPSIFVGVMPLLELKILEIHSFPQFSPTCFDIFSWKFTYDFILLYYRSSVSVMNLRQFFVGVMFLLELKVLAIHSFPQFSLTCFDILRWNFAYHFVLLYYRSRSSVLNFLHFL